MAYSTTKQMFSSFIPKVEIRRVVLEYSGEEQESLGSVRKSFFEKNPHIDDSQPQIETNESSLQPPLKSKVLKIKIDAALKQAINLKAAFSVLNFEDIKTALQIKMFLTDNTEDYNNLAAKRKGFSMKSKVKDWGDFSFGTMIVYEEIEKDGTRVKVYPFSFTFEINDDEPSSLGVISYACLDPQQLLENLVKDADKALMGNIIEGSRSHLLAINNGHVSSTLVQDFRSFNTIEELPLDFSITDNEVFSNLRKDLRGERIDINVPKTYFSKIALSKDPEHNCQFAFSLDWRKILIDNSLFGNLFRKDEEMLQLMTRSSIEALRVFRVRIAGSPQAGSDPFYQMLDGGIRTLGTLGNPKLFDSDAENKMIILTKDAFDPSRDRSILKSYKSKSGDGIQEVLNLGPPVFGFRHFGGTDRGVASLNDGHYQYKIEIEILDKSAFIVNEKLVSLHRHIKTLKKYYNKAIEPKRNAAAPPSDSPYIKDTREGYDPGEIIPGNYNVTTKRFTKSFIDRNTNNEGELIADLKIPIRDFIRTLKFFSKKWKRNLENQIRNSLMSWINPNIATPESIMIVIKLMETVSSKVSSVLGTVYKNNLSFTKDNEQSVIKKSITAKNRAFEIRGGSSEWFSVNTKDTSGFIFLPTSDNVSRESSDILTREQQLRPPGSQPISLSRPELAGGYVSPRVGGPMPSARQATDSGLRKISHKDYDLRVSEELQKFWTSDDTFLSDDLGSLLDTNGTYFTPSFIQLSRGPAVQVEGPTLDTSVETKPQQQNLFNYKSTKVSVKTAKTIDFLKPMAQNLAGASFKEEEEYDEEALKKMLNKKIVSSFGSNQDMVVESPNNPKLEAVFGKTTSKAPARKSPPEFAGCSSELAISEVEEKEEASTPILLSIVKDESGGPVKMADFDLRAKIRPRLSKTYDAVNGDLPYAESEANTEAKVRSILKSAPPQIKGLLHYETDKANYNEEVKELYESLSSDKSKYSEFVYKTQVINKIEAHVGYELDSEGEPLINKPIWKPIKEGETDVIKEFPNRSLVCRNTPYADENFSITRDENFDKQTYDEYFILEAPIDESKEFIDESKMKKTDIGDVLSMLAKGKKRRRPEDDIGKREEEEKKRRRKKENKGKGRKSKPQD
jgi:hypothetical protein